MFRDIIFPILIFFSLGTPYSVKFLLQSLLMLYLAASKEISEKAIPLHHFYFFPDRRRQLVRNFPIERK